MSSNRIPLGRAHLLASSAMREAWRSGVPAQSVTPVGSLRRAAPDIGDVALLAVAERNRHRDVLDAFAALPLTTAVTAQTPTSITIATQRGDITICLSTPEQRGAALVWHTGSRKHNEQLRLRARHLGFRFGAAQLVHDSHVNIDASTEEAVYRHLDLPCIPPELREGEEEIGAAEHGTLPNLISDLHIRGDLHMHSTWSDGRDSIESMVHAAQQLGYEYIAITDHSQRAGSSRKLSVEDVARQRDEIDALRGRVGGITILHGVEVDIMKDGSLDFSDDLLAGFDIVLASLHDHGGQEGPELTARYLQAIRHPLVNVVTHPTNRSPAQSAGYDVDLDAMFAASVETGTAMEIDGAPGHLDMDGAVARRAAAAGVTITVDSDCHRADALRRQMRFGIGTARRGWIEPRHVLNTRDVDTVRAFVAAKRARR